MRGSFNFIMNRYFIIHLTIALFAGNIVRAQVVLSDTVKSLEEVIIIKEKQTQDSKSGAAKLSRSDILLIPSLLGSNDPLKALQTLPGIINGGDGNAGLYVRGSDPGQTQILYNGIPVYNPNHLFGLYSVFNPNSIGSISIYKSAPPAWYGDRLAAFVDVESNWKSPDSLRFNLDIGLLASNIGLKAAVSKKTFADLQIRKSYMNYTVWPIVSSMTKKGRSYNKIRYDFYDLNIGIKHQLNDNNSLALSLYNGEDRFHLAISDSSNRHAMQWGNLLAGLQWNGYFKNQVSLVSKLYYTGYKFSFGVALGDIYAEIINRIQTTGLENKFTKRWKDHVLNAGISFKYHAISPYNTTSDVNGESNPADNILTQHALETNFFINDGITFSQKWFTNIGIRYTLFNYKGDRDSIINRKAYSWIAPSLSLRYMITSDLFLRLGANISYQPLHLIPVSTNALPIDFWIADNELMKPSTAKQFSLGIYVQHKKAYEAYLDIFYKRMNHLMEYTGYFSQEQHDDITRQFYYGKGDSYGAEILLKKASGKLTGSISYTFSRSLRQFAMINDGKQFPFKYDRPNQLVITAQYTLTERVSLGALFTFCDGSTYTPEIARYMIRDNVITEYGDYNSSRIAPYHRLDFSLVYKMKPVGKFRQEINFSVINVYNHKNVLYNYYKYTGKLSGSNPYIKSEMRDISVLPVIPSVVYKLSL